MIPKLFEGSSRCDNIGTVVWFSYQDLSCLAQCLTVRVRVCFCGLVEGSVARGHGLLSGWLKAASLFAYQISCDWKTADLHGRKPAELDLNLNKPRIEWERCTDSVWGVCTAVFFFGVFVLEVRPGVKEMHAM